MVYAHNGGRFDYHYLRDFIDTDKPISIINGRLARFTIGRCEFLDSMNLFNIPLSAFEKEEIDYSIFEAGERDKPKNRERIRDYLRSDCINLYNLITGFFDTYGRARTQAGAAMSYWTRHYSLEVPRQSVHLYERMKPFYYGGRVQCFANGNRKVNFSVVDINSAYPTAMLAEHPYSVGSEIKLGLPKGDALGPCLVKLKAVSRGALPFRTEKHELFFPHDEKTVREYFVTGWEIMAGLETNTLKIVKINECHVANKTANFRSYVEHFYDIKKQAAARKTQAERVAYESAKLFMNGLYGKFASNPARYAEFVLASVERLAEWELKGYTADQQWTQAMLMSRPLPENRRRYYNVATAASITGKVRAFLWESLCKCQGLIYCDTDSIAAENVTQLSLSPKLGDWKLEKLCDEFSIIGKKNYSFHEKGKGADSDSYKIASKGWRGTHESITRIAISGGSESYLPRQPTYSIHKPNPYFVPRIIRSTYKDISQLAA